MAILIDAATPAAVETTGTATPATTALFTPPAKSLLCALVGIGWTGTANTGAIALSDSGSHAWTQVRQEQGVTGNGGVLGIFYTYLVSAPGSITASAALSGFGTGTGGALLDLLVVTGAAATQNGAVASANPSTSAIDTSVAITTTVTGSRVFGITNDSSNNTVWTANGVTTQDVQYNDTTDQITVVSFAQTAQGGAPGSVTIGGSLATANSYQTIVWEIVPAAAVGAAPISLIVNKALRRSTRY